MRRRSLITTALIEETPLDKKKADAEKERLKKEATQKATKDAEAKVAAQERGAKTAGAAPPPPPPPPMPSGEAPMGPPPKPVEIPKLPPDELPRSEKTLKKRTPAQRAKDITKSMESRRLHLQKLVRDFYGVMGLAAQTGKAGQHPGNGGGSANWR